MKIPPYGNLIDNSKEPVFIWAGEKIRVHQTVRTFSKNMAAFYAPCNPKNYVWFVKDRDVAIVHFFEPQNFWVSQIVMACLKAGAAHVAEISFPHIGAWWNPHYDLVCEFYGKDYELVINNYKGAKNG